MRNRRSGNLLLPTLLLCGLVLGFATAGCFRHTIEKGSEIPDAAVAQLKIGQTTRSDVFKLLGPPHSMFEEQASLSEFYAFRFFGPGAPAVAAAKLVN